MKIFLPLLLVCTCSMLYSQNKIKISYKGLKDSSFIYSTTDLLEIDNIPSPATFDAIIKFSYLHVSSKEDSLARYLGNCNIDGAALKIFKDSNQIKIPFQCLRNDTSIKSVNIIIQNDNKNKVATLMFKSDGSQAKEPANTATNNTENLNRDSVLKKLRLIGISIDNASFVFIKPEMFDGLQTFGYSNLQHCMQNKYDKQLPGEYVWLYDMKNGDYYTLKKKVRKPITDDKKANGCKDTIGCKDCCVGIEYYKWKKSMWYTPPVGTQFKVELMNYSTADSINLSFAYRDNFLEDEANFKALLQSANSSSAPKDTTKKDTALKNPNNTQSYKPDETANNLLILRNDLSYYNDHFNYNSSTMGKHLQNLRYINKVIQDKFEISLDSLIRKYKVKQDTDDELNILMKQIEKLYFRISNYRTYSFLAQKLKNYDYLDMTFKDNKGNEINKEEMRLWGGFKIDFSSGIFLTGLKDDNYVFTDSTVRYRPFGDTSTSLNSLRDTTGKIAIKENSGKQKIAFGILMHAYPRISSNYNVALTVGLAVNTQTEVNVLLGGSLLLGSTRRLVLTYGVMWGKVNRLSNTVKTGLNRSDASNIYSAPIFYNTTNNLVPMVSDTYHSWFFGISYNFSSK